MPRHPSNLSRRRFLQVGGAGMLGIGLADLLQAESLAPAHAPRAKNIIYVWLNGGPATIDMWDPKPDAPSEFRGEFKSIPTAIPGVHFSEHLPRTAAILDRSTLVRSLRHNIPDHGPGSQYVMTGNKPSAALEYPSVGALASHLLTSSAGMPAYFTIGNVPNAGAGYLGSSFAPFAVSPPNRDERFNLEGAVLPEQMTASQLSTRHALRDRLTSGFAERHKEVDVLPTLSKFQAQAYDILASNRIGQAFDLSGEPMAIAELYGASPVGRHLLAARRLIEGGARVVSVAIDGWDTHVGNFTTLRQMLPPLDQALAGLVIDLDQRGLLDETLVVWGGEFGRTPLVTRTAGRDHWSRAIATLLAGGGLKGGCVHGATDPHGEEVTDGACTPDDLAATLLSQLGFPPDYKVTTTAGRPVELFERGRVIDF